MTEQLYLDGTAPPKNAEIDAALYAWLTSKREQKLAADATKIKHARLLEEMKTASIERYPYVDEFTGKKRIVALVKEPKARTLNAPSVRNKGRRGREKDVKTAEDGAQARIDAEAGRVESRRVKRSDVAAEIDPFGATRGEMANYVPPKSPIERMIDEATGYAPKKNAAKKKPARKRGK